MIYRQSLHTTEEVAAYYDAKYTEMGQCWHTPDNEIRQHLDDMSGGIASGSLLDIGCGDGSLVNVAVDEGFDAFGFELSRVALDLGSVPTDYWRVELRDICKEIRGTLPFNYIISLGSLEHVLDLDAALDNIHALLADDGIFYFFLPNETWAHTDQPNERVGTEAEWTEILASHGLVVTSTKRWNDSTAYRGTKGIRP